MYQVHVVENGLQAKEKIDQLTITEFTKENIYLFAHDKDRSEHLTENTDTESVGLAELGLIDKVSNIFKSRGDELRKSFVNLGLTENEANQYEKELDKGKVVLIASTDAK